MLKEFIKAMEEQNLCPNHIVVRKGGSIAAEHVFTKTEPQNLYSASKTFSAMAIGILEGEGLISRKDLITAYFPEKEAPYTIEDLLKMASGHDGCPLFRASQCGEKVTDLLDLFFQTPLPFPPGTVFSYNNCISYVFSVLVTKVSGLTLKDYLIPRLFLPLGIKDPLWETTEQGYTRGFSGLYLNAEELSRFGELLVNGGVFQGNRLIPEEFVKSAMAIQIATKDFRDFPITKHYKNGYGYQLWINLDGVSCRMEGKDGQFAVLFPEKEAVVTCLSREPERMHLIYEAIWDLIRPKL